MKNKARQDSKQETEQKPIRLYSTKEVAALWGISYWSVRELVISGRIKPVVGIGKGWLFTGWELREDMLERL